MSSSKRRSSDLLLEARAFRAHQWLTVDAIFNFFLAIDTPKSLAAWLLYKHNEHDQLTTIDLNPDHYGENPFMFRLDLAAVSFLSKARFLKTTFKKEEVAFTKFFKYEELCRETNYRFRNPLLDPLNHGPNVWLLNAVKRKISQVLGDFSPEEFLTKQIGAPASQPLLKGKECRPSISSTKNVESRAICTPL